jgi:hypothetical protein
MAVFVLDRRKKPLMPCPEKRTRLLLERQKAVVHKIAPLKCHSRFGSIRWLKCQHIVPTTGATDFSKKMRIESEQRPEFDFFNTFGKEHDRRAPPEEVCPDL